GLCQNFELLRLEPLLVVDVRAGPKPPHDVPLGVPHRQRAPEKPAVHAVVATKAVLDLVVFAGPQRMLPTLPRPLLVVRVHGVVPPGAARLFGAGPDVLVPAPVVEIVIPVRQRRPD